jgi:hypothetical protein
MMTFIKLAGGILVIAFLTWIGSMVFAAGQHSIQVKWDVDKAAIAQLSADTAAANAKKLADTVDANQGVIHGLQDTLTTLQSSNATLAERLRLATRPTAGGGAVPPLPSHPGPTDTPANPGLGPIDDAIAAALTECANTRASYEALIAEVKPQL